MASPSPEAPRRVFVTGGHGFIGRRVVDVLVERGHDVLAPYVTVAESWPGLPATTFELDLMDGAAARDAMAGCDLVVHLAARAGGIEFQQASQADIFLTNQRLTANVLAGAAASGSSRVYLASSAVVYAGGATEPLHEEAPLVTSVDASGYAWSKVCDEVLGRWYAASGRIEVVGGRFTNIYGPHAPGAGPATVIHDLAARALAASSGELEVWGDGTAVRSFLYVEDAAAGVVAILLGGENGRIYNVDAGVPVSIAEAAATVRDAVDPSLRLSFLPDRPSGVPYRVLDAARLAGLGFTARVGLAEGVGRTVAALRAAP